SRTAATVDGYLLFTIKYVHYQVFNALLISGSQVRVLLGSSLNKSNLSACLHPQAVSFFLSESEKSKAHIWKQVWAFGFQYQSRRSGRFFLSR
ncbi:MAG TPA: hypothetical protein PKE58_21725, partial [Acidobacteriota bacterium]|nr:hypothetical protein [Acidobacteriota bacterium]